MIRAKNGEPERFYQEVVLTWTSDECLLWPYAKESGGYGQMRLPNKIACLVHRRACEDVNGPPPSPSHEAAHSCGSGHLGCGNPGHLRWATRMENMADAVAHGTMARGRGTGSRKLDALKVAGIRNRLAAGVPQRQIAAEFGISHVMVGLIKRGHRW